MKERPILFDGQRVREILAGTKTSTRRIMNPQPQFDVLGDPGCWYPSYFKKRCLHYGNREHFKKGVANDFSPLGKPGDRLWVRECFSPDSRSFYPFSRFVYRADEHSWLIDKEVDNCRDDADTAKALKKKHQRLEGCMCDFRWRPSIHMPREASRINLEITEVSVERLQDGGDREFWGEEKWEENPWVWKYEFKII